MLQVKNPQDFWAGLLFIAAGATALWEGSDYTLGSITQMGPGYFPRVLSWILLGIGALLAGRGLVIVGPRIAPSLIRPQVLILLAIIVFGLTIERFGLAPAVLLATVLAALASRETRWTETIVLAVLLAAATVVLFIHLLGQSMQTWAF
jgi:hypothetical protein